MEFVYSVYAPDRRVYIRSDWQHSFYLILTFRPTKVTSLDDVGAIDVANVQNVLYHFWKERVLLSPSDTATISLRFPYDFPETSRPEKLLQNLPKNWKFWDDFCDDLEATFRQTHTSFLTFFGTPFLTIFLWTASWLPGKARPLNASEQCPTQHWIRGNVNM